MIIEVYAAVVHIQLFMGSFVFLKNMFSLLNLWEFNNMYLSSTYLPVFLTLSMPSSKE